MVAEKSGYGRRTGAYDTDIGLGNARSLVTNIYRKLLRGFANTAMIV